MTRRFAAFVLICMGLLTGSVAWAACTNPPGVASEIIYNADHNVVQFCNGTNWISTASSGATSLPGGSPGAIQFNSNDAFGGNVKLFWDNSLERLGVGTSSPAQTLDVVGDAAISGAVTMGSTLDVTGAVTAASFSGSGAALTALSAGNISSGTVATARLGSGTADSSTYLRGDGAWSSVSAGTTLPDCADGQIVVRLGGAWICRDHSAWTCSFTWTERTSAGFRKWESIASNSDGTKLAAGVDGGYIYTSSDSGATWTERATSGDWHTIASSSDGTKLAAGSSGYIYTSNDSGVNWTVRTGAGNYMWHAIASSSDGAKLAAGPDYGFIYTSSDSGVNWTVQGGSGANRRWRGIASSSNGAKLAAVAENYTDYVYTSSDSGATWTQRTAPGYQKLGIASSSDGTRLALCGGNNIYTSSDSGASWTARLDTSSWSTCAVASSSDGTKLAAGVDGGYIHISSDSGATWTQETSAGRRNWQDIASSSDGNELAAVTRQGYIYTGAVTCDFE